MRVVIWLRNWFAYHKMLRNEQVCSVCQTYGKQRCKCDGYADGEYAKSTSTPDKW